MTDGAALRARVQGELRTTEACSMAVAAFVLPQQTPVVLALVTSRSAVREGERALFVFGTPATPQLPLPLLAVAPLTRVLVSDVAVQRNSATGAVQMVLTRSSSSATVFEAADRTPAGTAAAHTLFTVVRQCAQLLEVPAPTDDHGPFGWTRRYGSPDQVAPSTTTTTTTATASSSSSLIGGAATTAAATTTMTRLLQLQRQQQGGCGSSSEAQNVSVFFGTWNVNGQTPPAEGLDAWLGREGAKPDVYCIGFQELDLSASALVLGDTSKAEPWVCCIAATLSKYGDYVQLATKQLVGILLCVFVRRALTAVIRDVQSDIMPVGIMGVMGNKGGVGIRFDIHDSTFCVVNSHLNAHVDNVARRNQDYHDIARELVFFRHGRRISIWDHDYLFWIGDLNYRILGADTDVRNSILRGDYDLLLAHDQLREQQRERRAFEPFTEAPILFAPTYKYDHNSTAYDTSAQSRCPAWCDRVLWREPTAAATHTASVVNIDYMRHELLTSDHRPVSAVFVIRTHCASTSGGSSALRRTLYVPAAAHAVTLSPRTTPAAAAAAARGLPAQPLSPPPTPPPVAAVAFSANELDFGLLTYMEPQSRKLIVRNTGNAVARWSLQPHTAAAPGVWFQVAPTTGELQPGAQTAILVAACVDRSLARFLVPPNAALTGELVLRLDGSESTSSSSSSSGAGTQGKEYRVTVAADYECSCFGLTVEQLVRLRGPVRTGTLAAQRTCWVPRELWRLVDALVRDPRTLDTPELFLRAGPPAEQRAVRECLDTGAPFPAAVAPHSLAAVLVRLLEQLGQPLLAPDVRAALLHAGTTHAECRHVLAQRLSDEQYTTFYYVVAFLRELAAHSAHNGLTPERLAVLFSGVLVPPADPAADTKDADFVVYRFLVE